ncbi:hypothetical protein BD410DRAFT_810719, partial [Rickenella mellea]
MDDVINNLVFASQKSLCVAHYYKVRAKICYAALGTLALSMSLPIGVPDLDGKCDPNPSVTQLKYDFLLKFLREPEQAEHWTELGLMRTLYYGVAISPLEWLTPKTMHPDHHGGLSLARLTEFLTYPSSLNDPLRLSIEADILLLHMKVGISGPECYDETLRYFYLKWKEAGYVPPRGESKPENCPSPLLYPPISEWNSTEGLITFDESESGSDEESGDEDTVFEGSSDDSDSDDDESEGEPSKKRRKTGTAGVRGSGGRDATAKKRKTDIHLALNDLQVRRAVQLFDLEDVVSQPVDGSVEQLFIFDSPVIKPDSDGLCLDYESAFFQFDLSEDLGEYLKALKKIFKCTIRPTVHIAHMKFDPVRDVSSKNWISYPIESKKLTHSCQNIHIVNDGDQPSALPGVTSWQANMRANGSPDEDLTRQMTFLDFTRSINGKGPV